MPSASAKVEKFPIMETTDPLKLFSNMLEKRMRNMEKRKMKLDNYRSDVENGKELNEDQKMAVSKYDSVIGVLDFAKDLAKAMQSIVMDSVRQQKKQAKKEQLERQLYEIQRLQNAFIYCHILSCFQNEDVRSDFLNGENGAVQLTSEQLSQLDQLYKLIGPGLPNEQADITSHFHVLAENHIFLVEGKNKEIAGTTYKVLKDLLCSIKESGYFSRPSESLDDGTSSDEMPEEETLNEHLDDQMTLAEQNIQLYEPVQSPCDERIENIEIANINNEPVQEEVASDLPSSTQNGPLQEVLVPESSFNFLQESQIDLDAPHMDPAVVAVHQMAPPPAVNFSMNPYPPSPHAEETSTQPMVNGHHEPTDPSPINPVVPVLAPVQHDFDPSHPIPTQTFTNQSFAVMQNMILPQAYVPVTMHHGPLPPHMAPIAVVPGPAVTSAPAVVPIPVAVAPVQDVVLAGLDGKPVLSEIQVLKAKKVPEKPILNGQRKVTRFPKKQDSEVKANGISSNASEADHNSNEAPAERGADGEGNGFPPYRGGFRGRGRGRGNGFFRGRANYHNGRGGFQNHYFQDRNGYNGNFRRGNNRGGPRGNGNNRGRGNYRTQQQQQQQQPPPAAAPHQQTQQ